MIPSLPPWKAILGVLTVFICGLFFGAFLVWQTMALSGPPMRHHNPHEMFLAVTHYLQKELKLSEDQRQNVEITLKKMREQIHEQIEPTINTIVHQSREAIRQQLDEKQRLHFDELVEKHDRGLMILSGPPPFSPNP